MEIILLLSAAISVAVALVLFIQLAIIISRLGDVKHQLEVLNFHLGPAKK